MTVSGTVRNGAGLPIPGVTIRALRSVGKPTAAAAAVTQTSNSGEYILQFPVSWWSEKGRFGYQAFTLRLEVEGFCHLERVIVLEGRRVQEMTSIDFVLVPTTESE